MKNIIKIAIFLVMFAGLSLTAHAMNHKAGDANMDHGNMGSDKMDHSKMGADKMDHGNMDHGSMAMDGEMIMLGNSVQDGVKAMAHLKDVKATMSKMGMSSTHHIMVMFADESSGEPIHSGAAAVKVKDAQGNEGEAVKLMGMEGHFGADIELKQAGDYHFTVGTKLADGKQRTFEFDFTLK